MIAGFTLGAARLYQSSEDRQLEESSREIADRVAQRLKAEIQGRTSVLKVIAKSSESMSPAVFEKLAASLVREYPGFYSINLVDRTGEITRVHPAEANRAALGQNLLERADVREYLLAARASKEPRMSHKLMTYQRVPAFTLYVPIFKPGGEFDGWLNGVVDFDAYLITFLMEELRSPSRIIIKWDHPESAVIDQGPRSIDRFFSFSHRVLNQRIIVEIGFAPDAWDLTRRRRQVLIIAAGSALLLVSLVLLMGLNLSRLRLDAANSHLMLKNSLLSSLSHDMSGPLTALSLNLEPVMEGKVPTDEERTGIARALKGITEMIANAKLLHARSIGVLEVSARPVSLAAAAREAVGSVGAQAAKKGVRMSLSAIPEDLLVLADASTLINNVLLNALTNAIKFSPEGGEVRIGASASKSGIRLAVEDDGSGLTPDQLRSFRGNSRVPSRAGTLGEAGTGLGLLQIRELMAAYRGRVEVENLVPRGFRLTLVFEKA